MRAAVLRMSAAMEGFPTETIALIVALGFVLGTFPVFGCPTLLCLAAALIFRINLPALQVMNQLSSPLQWALMIPLVRVGWLVAGRPAARSVETLALQAVVGWLLVCVPLGLALYFPLAHVLRGRRFN